MYVSDAYDQWSGSYDSMQNKTRDLEAFAIRELLSPFRFRKTLELGCGTGKNTAFLVTISEAVTSVDFSEEMMDLARQKINSSNAQFIKADISFPWNFAAYTYDLLTCSLVLEHISDLDHIFKQAANVMQKESLFYIGELHPFKQYSGSKARFEQNGETVAVTCYTHHISEFMNAAKQYGFSCEELKEYFDEENKEVPRIIAFLFRKN